MPTTGFVHVTTSDGLLDIVQYEEYGDEIFLLLGSGVRFSMTRTLSARCTQLEWNGYNYTAAPPEFMFVTKAVGYAGALHDGTRSEYENTKHYADLRRLVPVIDWAYAAYLLNSMRVGWRHSFFPPFVQKLVNPYAALDLERLRALLM